MLERTLSGKVPGTVEGLVGVLEVEQVLVKSLDKLMDTMRLVTWGMSSFHREEGMGTLLWCRAVGSILTNK